MIKDSYRIFTPMLEDEAKLALNYVNLSNYADFYESSKNNLKHAVNGFSYIKYLRAFDCGKAISRKEANKRTTGTICGPDNWKRLVGWHLLECDHKDKFGCSYWKLTEDGAKVLQMANANEPYYKVMRWYDNALNEDELISQIMKEDLAGLESWKSQMAEGFIGMFNAIFNPESLCRKTGASYRWINKIIYLCKTREDFFNKVVDPEVIAWFNGHIQFDGVQNFVNLISRMQKKLMKAKQKS